MMGLSRAHSEVRNLSISFLSQLSEAVAFTSPFSKSTSSTSARGKPIFTTSSSSMGKISSERSAESRRRAAASPVLSCMSRTGLSRMRGLATGAIPCTFSLAPSAPPRRGAWHAACRLNGQFRFRAGAKLWSRNQAGKTNGIGVLQIRVDGCHHDACFNRDQVNADEGDAHPGVNNDALVQYSVEDID